MTLKNNQNWQKFCKSSHTAGGDQTCRSSIEKLWQLSIARPLSILHFKYLGRIDTLYFSCLEYDYR